VNTRDSIRNFLDRLRHAGGSARLEDGRLIVDGSSALRREAKRRKVEIIESLSTPPMRGWECRTCSREFQFAVEPGQCLCKGRFWRELPPGRDFALMPVYTPIVPPSGPVLRCVQCGLLRVGGKRCPRCKTGHCRHADAPLPARAQHPKTSWRERLQRRKGGHA
jgi:hypothetical protein